MKTHYCHPLSVWDMFEKFILIYMDFSNMFLTLRGELKREESVENNHSRVQDIQPPLVTSCIQGHTYYQVWPLD